MIFCLECHRMRKETIAKAVESNMELEQLRESVSQYSVAASLNEVYQKQMHYMQQELVSERLQIKEERKHLEEKIDSLKTEIHSEKAKCKRYEEEKLLNNTVMTKLEERLKRTECDKQFFQQQMHELIARLATCEYELQLSKDTIKKNTDELNLLRIESEGLTEAFERLSKTNEVINEPQIQLHKAEETKRDLLNRLKENEVSLDVADEETFDQLTTPSSTSEENSSISKLTVNLQKELDIERHHRKELEDKVADTTAQLEQLVRKSKGMEITFVSHGRLLLLCANSLP